MVLCSPTSCTASAAAVWRDSKQSVLAASYWELKAAADRSACDADTVGSCWCSTGLGL